MKKYISKDYIDNLLNKYLDSWWGPEYYACCTIQDEIENVPEPAIVYMYECSECGLMISETHRYCPYCGKIMNGDESNEN